LFWYLEPFPVFVLLNYFIITEDSAKKTFTMLNQTFVTSQIDFLHIEQKFSVWSCIYMIRPEVSYVSFVHAIVAFVTISYDVNF